jgi:hypothetical protein
MRIPSLLAALALISCFPTPQMKSGRGDRLHGDRLDEGFDALVAYRIRVVDHTTNVKDRTLYIMLTVPDEIAAVDPVYQEEKRRWGLLAIGVIQAPSYPVGGWVNGEDGVVYKGEAVSQARAGDYDWTLVITEGDKLTALPLPGRVTLAAASLTCLGLLAIEIFRPDDKDKAPRVEIRATHDFDPAVDEVLRAYPSLSARFRDTVGHRPY